ncbi:MAG: HAMP domain-containing sensor histidine kinase [Sulfurimonas sp.]|nr:HAMP domain-containing sensor histidine kinase [Sulfurimonas sp.]
MKKVELESLIKSFILFFVSQSLLLGTLFFFEYTKEIKSLDESLFNEMRVCSYDLRCDNFSIDFVPKDKFEVYKLYKNEDGLSGYFSIGASQKNSMKIHYHQKDYEQDILSIQKDLALKLFIVLVIIILLSIVFSFYTLSPLRNALKMTEEFIKDILHDFNTPLSTLRLNLSMLKTEIGENKKISRIENTVQNILNLQSNLRSYLSNHALQKERFDIKEFLQERVSLLEKNYKQVRFILEVSSVQVELNRDSFGRIVDNILSNAAKYNKQNGEVKIVLEDNKLIISDTGKGIKNPKRVFERFYKEQDRGIGIGLHIVKKLCDEMGIEISVESEVGKGSIFTLVL